LGRLKYVGVAVPQAVELLVLRQPQENLLDQVLGFGRIAGAFAEIAGQRGIVTTRQIVQQRSHDTDPGSVSIGGYGAHLPQSRCGAE